MQVLVGTCKKQMDEGATRNADSCLYMNKKTGLPIDTFTEESNSIFFKARIEKELIRINDVISLVSNV